MSNVLIIKHGSLGDIAQVSGAIQDIKEKHYRDQVFILTTPPYVDLLSRCPHIDGVIIDKRNKRWNLFYLLKLRRQVQRFNFIKVYDLQNSSRTSFYRKFLFRIKDWSSSETTIPKEDRKSDFEDKPVLDRFEHQLKNSGIETINCMNHELYISQGNYQNYGKVDDLLNYKSIDIHFH